MNFDDENLESPYIHTTVSIKMNKYKHKVNKTEKEKNFRMKKNRLLKDQELLCCFSKKKKNVQRISLIKY